MADRLCFAAVIVSHGRFGHDSGTHRPGGHRFDDDAHQRARHHLEHRPGLTVLARADARAAAGPVPGRRRPPGADDRRRLRRAGARAAGRGLPPDGHRPPVRRPGHRADQAGAPRGLPLLARPGGLPGRRGAGAAARRLGLPDLPRVRRAGHPRHRPGRGADPAARRLALRLRPGGDAGRRPSARRWPPSSSTPRASRTARRARAAAPSRWRSSATARPARATSTRRSTSPPCSRRRSCSSSRTTGTRSASRSRSRPRRRRWRTRGSATASRREQVDGNDPMAVLAVLNKAVGARALGRRPGARRGAHLPHGRRTPTPTTPPATATRTRSTAGCGATRSPGWRPTCAAQGLLDDEAVAAVARRGRGRRRRRARRA